MVIPKHEKILIIIFLLLCAIFVLNIGYAQTSDDRETINGNGEFNIIFNNGKIVSSLGVNLSNTYIKTSHDLKNIYLNVADLEYPGANVEFSVDVINNGSIDAKIASIIAHGFENSKVFKFRILNQEVFKDEVLKPGERVSINFIIELDKNASVVVDETVSFNIEINCIQAI